MSFRSKIKSGRRNLIAQPVNGGYRLASADKSRSDVVPFGPVFADMTAATAYATQKRFGTPTVEQKKEEKPVPKKRKPSTKKTVTKDDDKPLTVYTPKETLKKSFWDFTVPQLRAMYPADQPKPKGFGKMTKAQVIDALQSAGVKAAA